MKKIRKKGIAILLLIMQIFMIITAAKTEQASIANTITMLGDHECDSLVEYWMEDYQKWSYKIVWYVYYQNETDGKTYPAFCVEPAKEGVGTGYDSYQADVEKETDPGIWRILYKGYMGKKYTDYNLECDDDLYSATKIALHSYTEGSVPIKKYKPGTRPLSGNTPNGDTVEEIQRRGKKVLEVAQELYEYGINGTEKYEEPEVTIKPANKQQIKTVEGKEYVEQTYLVQANREIQNYHIQSEGFTKQTKIVQNKYEILVQIPTEEIRENIQGKIKLEKIQIKTQPIYLCKSKIEGAQNYVTYTSGIEEMQAQVEMEVEANTATLQIQKVDKQTQKPLPGVSFEITNEKGEKLGTYETNENGIIQLENLKPQTIGVQEVKTIEGYRIEKEKQFVTLQWGKTSTITIENEKQELPVLPKTGY